MQISQGVRLSYLAAVSPEQKASVLDALIDAALNPDEEYLRQQCDEVDSRIRKFERRYEMSSNAMKQRLSQGLIKETAEICSWLLLLRVKNSIEIQPDAPQSQSLSELL